MTKQSMCGIRRRAKRFCDTVVSTCLERSLRAKTALFLNGRKDYLMTISVAKSVYSPCIQGPYSDEDLI